MAADALTPGPHGWGLRHARRDDSDHDAPGGCLQGSTPWSESASGFRATLHSLVGQPGPGRARAQDQAVQRRVVLGPLLSLVLTLHTGSLAPDAAQPGPDAAHWQPGAGRCTAWSWARKGTEK
jgi:hypothetical protein